MLTATNFNNKLMPFRQNKISSTPSRQNISFCSRPEYDYFEKNYDIRASNYFRRGQCYGAQKEEFQDVIDAIKLVFSENTKPKILLVGLGEAQEPFSFLSVIKDLKQKEPLASVVEMNCVDLQPKISNEALNNYSYLDCFEPLFAKKSFDFVYNPEYKSYFHYKVKPDISDYLKEVFNNPEKTKWDTKIEEFAEACPEKTYNMVSMNNTLMYISDQQVRINTMNNVSKMLKTGGILVTDVYDDVFKKTFSCLKDFKNLKPGIWQKLV